jgi:hypothetical protein
VEAFWIDLSRLVRKWTEAGESVVIMVDWNNDVRGGARKYMAELVMREVFTELHGQDGPRTYNRGSTPIDGIFMTQDLYIIQGVYMPFDKGIGSDHQCIWIDILIRVLMGQDLEQPRKFAAQRLKYDDPRVMNKYFKHYDQYIKKRKLQERIRALA